MQTLNSLRVKVFGILLLLFLLVSGLLTYLSWSAQLAQETGDLQQQLAQLQTRGDGFFRQSEAYIGVAPRDYPDYFRDVQVFYPDFVANLNDLDKQVMRLQESYLGEDKLHWQQVFGLSLRNRVLDKTVSGLTASWQAFHNGLQEQLGDNMDEPRLEWGTQFIRDHQGQVREAVNQLIAALRQQLDIRSQRIESIGHNGMLIVGAFSLLLLSWFYLVVIRRITHSIDGCVRVAKGEFGYQMPTRGKDEISLLGRAINQLSAKARLSMTLQERLGRAVSQDEALQAIWEESQSIFELLWVGLYHYEDEKAILRIRQALPSPAPSMLKRQHLQHQRVMDPVVKADQPVAIGDLGNHLEIEPQTRFVRDLLLAQKEGHSVLFLPLSDSSGEKYVLAMTSSKANAFLSDNVSLLQNMRLVLQKALFPEQVVEKTVADQ